MVQTRRHFRADVRFRQLLWAGSGTSEPAVACSCRSLFNMPPVEVPSVEVITATPHFSPAEPLLCRERQQMPDISLVQTH